MRICVCVDVHRGFIGYWLLCFIDVGTFCFFSFLGFDGDGRSSNSNNMLINMYEMDKRQTNL